MNKTGFSAGFGSVLQGMALLVVMAVLPAAYADSSGLRLFGNQCASCHGKQGEGNPGVKAPALAGLDAAYLLRQLQHFRDGVRGAHADDPDGAIMRASVRNLTDANMSELVEAITRWPQPPAATLPTGADLTAGRNYYNGICSSCHGGKAEGISALNAPRLTGQSAEYLTRQFLNFRTKIRGGHASDKYGKQMVAVSKSLPTDKLVTDVSAYIVQLSRTP